MKAQHLALVIGLTFTAFASQTKASQVNDDKAAFSDAYQSYLTAVKRRKYRASCQTSLHYGAFVLW